MELGQVRTKDRRDVYYRLAKREDYRARSAYKLLQIQEAFDVFANVSRVVDLCAAPGSWSQVLARHIQDDDRKIVSIDLNEFAPIPGVVGLVGDITDPDVATAVIDQFNGENADLVVCDGAPDVVGLPSFDEFLQANLLNAATNIATILLRPGGTFLAKVFRGRCAGMILDRLSLLFDEVFFAKPRSSRAASYEAFVICRNFNPPGDFTPSLDTYLPGSVPSDSWKDLPFFVCGDLSLDSDATYS